MHADSSTQPTGSYLAVLSLAALGVVYGDIGTSPLYSVKEVFSEHYGLVPSPENVLGVLSLIFWSLIIVISVKYLVFVMRADLKGEGGIMVLTALVTPTRISAPGGATEPDPVSQADADAAAAPGETRAQGAQRVGRRRTVLIALGLFGAALLYGDGIITPAISVLSAIEGLSVATDFFEAPERGFLIPLITIVILVVLFMFQRRGTAQPWIGQPLAIHQMQMGVKDHGLTLPVCQRSGPNTGFSRESYLTRSGMSRLTIKRCSGYEIQRQQDHRSRASQNGRRRHEWTRCQLCAGALRRLWICHFSTCRW